MTTTFKSKTFKVYYFEQDADKRDLFLSLYVIETTVNSSREENDFYNGLNPESNLLIIEI